MRSCLKMLMTWSIFSFFLLTIYSVNFVNCQRRWNGWFGNRNHGFGQRYSSNNNNYVQYGHQQQQQSEVHFCTRPVFTSDDAELSIDNCNNRYQNYHVCRNSNSNIPGEWKSTMLCQKGTLILKFSSTCSHETGDWNPPFPQNCYELYAQSLKEFSAPVPKGQGESQEDRLNPLQITTTTIKPEYLIFPEGQQFPATQWQGESNTLNPCFPLTLELNKNFMYYCVFPGESEEVEGCMSDQNTKLASGTKAFLKCKPPFHTQPGQSHSEWVCNDGEWSGSFKKLICYFSSKPNSPSPSAPNPVHQETTQRPDSYTHNNNHSNFGRPPYVDTLPTPDWGNTAPAVNVSSWYTHDNQKPKPEQYIPPRIHVTTTTTTSKPVVNHKVKMCPALVHRPQGVKLDCVSQGEHVTTSNCSIPLPIGSEASYTCRAYHESTTGLVTLFRKCREDGTWTGNGDSFACIIECGRANQVKIPFITSGLPTVRAQWPWHAGIFLKETKTDAFNYICGGTLISSKAILTAAHCVTLVQTRFERNVTTLRVDLGKFRREEIDDLVQTSDVGSIHIHDSYNPYGYDSDIAIIVFKTAIQIGYHVRPICFPQTSDSVLEELQLAENSIGTVVGWGNDENRKLGDELRMARLKVIGPNECSETIKSAGAGQLQTRSTTYCAGFKNGTNVCNGDSGGGMYFPSKNSESTRWYLQGLVSVGIANDDGQCNPNQYSVFTRVGRYASWITKTLSVNDAQ